MKVTMTSMRVCASAIHSRNDTRPPSRRRARSSAILSCTVTGSRARATSGWRWARSSARASASWTSLLSSSSVTESGRPGGGSRSTGAGALASKARRPLRSILPNISIASW